MAALVVLGSAEGNVHPPLKPIGVHTGTPVGVPPSTDCAIRKAAYYYGRRLQPLRAAFGDLYDALQLGACGMLSPPRMPAESWVALEEAIPHGQRVLYVDAATMEGAGQLSTEDPDGRDSYPNIAAAVAASRALPKPLTIALRGGTHFLVEPLHLGAADSRLTIRNAPGERAAVSGGQPLRPKWTRSSACAGCFEASLVGQVTNVPGLRRDGNREIRARYPNFDPERAGVIDGKHLVHDGRAGLLNLSRVPRPTWIPKGAPRMNGCNYSWPPAAQAETIVVDAKSWPSIDWPMCIETNGTCDRDRWTGEGSWGQHWLGVGGPCADRDPPAMYWCAPGAPRGIAQPNHPSGVILTKAQLPHLPYKKPRGMIISGWGYHHWYTSMFEVGDPVNGSWWNGSALAAFFSRGGTQGAEGSVGWGAEFHVESVLEELDMGREFFFDNESQVLYYKGNTTANSEAARASPQGTFVATRHRVLFNISGTQHAPAKDITIAGLVIRDSALSYFEPHGLPSGGDWALARQGAVTIVGSEGVTLRANLFTKLDGTACFIGDYNRNLTIANNEFSWIGESAIASWGSTSQRMTEDGTKTVPWAIGPDGRAGNQPRGTHVLSNIMREIGIFQKQSSAWFQAVSAQTLLAGNVIFNGPRAAINFNDGFGGGDVLRDNLVLNQVRESGDHGPINAWDRVPFITTLRNGTPSIRPADRHIHHNFILATYNSEGAVDTDDGSAYYQTHDNFFAYGANGLKSDFGGHDNHHTQNFLAFVLVCFGAPMPFRYFKGLNNEFVNNSCVALGSGLGAGVYSSDCYLDKSWKVSDNRVFTSSGDAEVCGKPWKAWFASNSTRDVGTTITKWPTDAELVRWAEHLLNFTVND